MRAPLENFHWLEYSTNFALFSNMYNTLGQKKDSSKRHYGKDQLIFWKAILSTNIVIIYLC